MDNELCATQVTFFHTNFSVVLFGYGGNDGKAQTATTGISGATGIEPGKGFKDAFFFTWWNTGAIVLNN